MIIKYLPNYSFECYICGRHPCVTVPDHLVPDTQLCGECFFKDSLMTDPDNWPDIEEGEESNGE